MEVVCARKGTEGSNPSLSVMNCFKSEKNIFGGCVVEPSALPESPDEFAAQLKFSLEAWKAEGIKVVWLAVSISQAELIPLCTAAGFIFHHAEGDILQMTLALIPDSFVPAYATHYIGAGGVVIDENRNLLVISERYKQQPGRRLKLPGGAMEDGEHIAAGVVREVREETGIEARFDYAVCLRHWHNYRYGKSDIYFVCRLTPLTSQIHMDTRELSECLWMPLDDFLNDPDIHGFNKTIVRAAAESNTGLREKYITEYNTQNYELLVL